LISKENPDRWEENAACSHPVVDPDLWSSPLRAEQAEAIHICLTHCPVLAECSRFFRPGRGTTSSGVTYRQMGRENSPRAMSPQPIPPDTCDLCDALS
jgi:hypothetical protein